MSHFPFLFQIRQRIYSTEYRLYESIYCAIGYRGIFHNLYNIALRIVKLRRDGRLKYSLGSRFVMI